LTSISGAGGLPEVLDERLGLRDRGAEEDDATAETPANFAAKSCPTITLISGAQGFPSALVGGGSPRLDAICSA